jgi:hypothetical protein
LQQDYRVKLNPEYAKKKAAFDNYGHNLKPKKQHFSDFKGQHRVNQDMDQYRADMKFYNENFTE